MLNSEMICERCLKPPALCFCSQLNALKTRLRVLILQHPQEPDKLLGSAKLAQLSLEKAQLKVGLSWPNLAKALGSPTPVEPSSWGVLFLGGRQKSQNPPPIQLLSKKGAPLELDENPLQGIVVLDGTWAQAKTMWWRNAWLLKLKRIVLNPRHKSLYQNLRKEPRRECLSTLEAIAETLVGLGEPEEVGIELKKNFKELLTRYEQAFSKNTPQEKLTDN